MTPVEIAYFKHFMFDKALERMYQRYYRRYRITGSPRGDKDGNPESIEEFFLKTTVKDVIMKAFFFAPTNIEARSNYTFDYWKDIDDKWQEYMKSNASNFTNDSWPNLRKTFAILRQNWDAPFYWKKENYESTEEVYKRMHINLPLPEVLWGHGGVIISKSKEEDEQVESADTPLLDFQSPEVSALYNPKVPDPLADFEFFEAPNPPGLKLKYDEVSLNFNSDSYKLTFNIAVSEEIKNSGLELVRLAKNKAGDICLILNNHQGTRLRWSHRCSKQRENVMINSKNMTTTIRTYLLVKSDYSVLNIEKLNSTPEYLIYKLTRK